MVSRMALPEMDITVTSYDGVKGGGPGTGGRVVLAGRPTGGGLRKVAGAETASGSDARSQQGIFRAGRTVICSFYAVLRRCQTLRGCCPSPARGCTGRERPRSSPVA